MSARRWLATLGAHAALLARRRPGPAAARGVPTLTRSAAGVTPEPGWLDAYRRCCAIPAEATLPPLAPQLLAAPLHLGLLADPRFPLRALGIVHVGQEVVERAPLAPDAPLDLRAALTVGEPSARGIEIVLRTTAHEAGAAPGSPPAWEARTVALWRARRQARAAASGGTRDGRARDDGSRDDGSGTEHAHVERSRDDVSSDRAALTSATGAPLRTTVIAVPEDMGRRYAAIAGDLNPIHQHALLARPFGFRTAIAHGTWTLARALAACADDLPPRPRRIEATFRKPVPLPARVVVTSARGADGRCELVVAPPARGTLHVEAAIERLTN